MALRVDADLRLETAGGTLQLQGSGRRLQLRLPPAGPLPRPIPSRGALARIADLLARQGLTLDIVDDAGPLLSLGAGRRSRSGALLFSTPSVTLRRPLRLLWRRLRELFG